MFNTQFVLHFRDLLFCEPKLVLIKTHLKNSHLSCGSSHLSAGSGRNDFDDFESEMFDINVPLVDVVLM